MGVHTFLHDARVVVVLLVLLVPKRLVEGATIENMKVVFLALEEHREEIHSFWHC